MANRPAPPPRLATVPSTPSAAPRLGMVMRFTPDAAATGIKDMQAGGMRVASSRDFRTAAAVPNDFGGADVQYFERFGIAIVRSQPDRLQPLLQKAMAQKVVTAARAERTYALLGGSARPRSAAGAADAGYLRGYRDGVNRLIDQLLSGEETQAARIAALFDETAVTWGLEAIRADLSALTGAGIRVAVLDTGFDDTHADFAGRAITKKLFASHSSNNDSHGHGTHCIGTACGPLRPTSGPRYGIAHEAEIFAGKVVGDVDGLATDRSMIAGMHWALDEGCQIISMSLGAEVGKGDQPNGDYEHIGQICLDSGALVVAAAGNNSGRPGLISPVNAPANASTIMAVAAVDQGFRPAWFSCGGVNPGQDVDIAAPGMDVLSCAPGGGHVRMDGTSMATPHVAGVAALIAQADPNCRGGALWARLLQLTRRLNQPAPDVGTGLLQAPPG